jgi:hypothetical protein
MTDNPVFGKQAVNFFLGLKKPAALPSSINIINPYSSPEVKSIVSDFYNKFYNDNRKRIFLFGINPGRYGGGITGIPFTDPAALEDYCSIPNSFKKQRELSSIFIYELIKAFGGTEIFFQSFYLTALYPLAITMDNKNYNFYDNPAVLKYLYNDIKNSVKAQIKFGAVNNIVISLGKKNAVYLSRINEELGLFKKIEIFEHPRFIMQYKRKNLTDYLTEYTKYLTSLKNKMGLRPF